MTELPTRIFYSYSHKDDSARESLETHLSILRRKGFIEEWHDRRIIPGQEWDEEIDHRLEQSDIILLLVSPDFIASDYCFGKEMIRALEKQDAHQARVIPIIIRPADWEGAPFSKLHALPTDAVPVSTWTNVDEAWLDVARGVREAVEDLRRLAQRQTSASGFRTIKDLLTDQIDSIESVFNSEKSCGGLPTGYSDLDEITDGLHKGDFIIIAARPNMRKTDLALNIAEHCAIKNEAPVALVSLRMPADLITRRLTSSLSRINADSILRGQLTDDEWPRLTAAVSLLVETPLFIDDKLGMALDEVCDRIQYLNNDKSLGLVVIDSLQHLSRHRTDDEVSDEISEISRKIKSFAVSLNIPVLATCQISRNVEARVNKRPLLTDLGQWNTLVEDADVISFVYRDEIYNYDSPDKGIAEIIIAKNRNGPIGTIRFTYLQPYCRFETYTFSSKNV